LLIAAIGVVFGLILASSLYAFSFAVALGPFASWSWIGLYLKTFTPRSMPASSRLSFTHKLQSDSIGK